MLSSGAGLLATCSHSTFGYGCQLNYHDWCCLKSAVSNDLNVFSHFWGIVGENTHLLHELIVFRCLTGQQGLIALLCAFFVLVLCATWMATYSGLSYMQLKNLSRKLLMRWIMVFQVKVLKIICDACWGMLCLVWGLNLGVLYSKHLKIRVVFVLVDFALCLKIGCMFSESWWFCMPPGAIQIQ